MQGNSLARTKNSLGSVERLRIQHTVNVKFGTKNNTQNEQKIIKLTYDRQARQDER